MDEFIDKRDSNRYKIIKIGNLLWFAENLRYRGVPHHFPNRDSDNIQEYGCLYDWSNAVKACPEGWRLPTKDEFDQLLTTTGAEDNSSGIRDSSWENSSNSSGFSALPAGLKLDNHFVNFGSYAYFWSATPYGRDYAYYLYVESVAHTLFNITVDLAFSVRCVKEV